jgi:hypothetical protein
LGYLIARSFDAINDGDDLYAIVPLDKDFVLRLLDIYQHHARLLFEKDVICVDVRCDRVYWFSCIEGLWEDWVYECVYDAGAVTVYRIPKALSRDSLQRRDKIVKVEYPHLQIFPGGSIKWEAFHSCTDYIIYTLDAHLDQLAALFDLEIQIEGDKHGV